MSAQSHTEPITRQITDPDSEMVQEALTRRCHICRAPIGTLCANPIRPGSPLPGRLIHLHRMGK